jgi:hypothetical protein
VPGDRLRADDSPLPVPSAPTKSYSRTIQTNTLDQRCGHVSRIETRKAYPSLAEAIACSIVFDTPPTELFPELYGKVHKLVIAQAEELYQKLQGNPSRVTRAKLDFLEEVRDRAHPHVRDMIV